MLERLVDAWRHYCDGPVVGNASLRVKGAWVIVGDFMLHNDMTWPRDVFRYNVYDEQNCLFVSTTFYQKPDGTYEIRQLRNKVLFPIKKDRRCYD